jgi:hypothetical protein
MFSLLAEIAEEASAYAFYENFSEMKEFLMVCKILDDKERSLAEADGNGWQLEAAQ